MPEPGRECSEDDCSRPVHARGLCGTHHQARRKAELKASGVVCIMDDCGKPVLNLKRQLCMGHYGRFLKYGDPSLTGRPDLGKALAERFWEKVERNGPIPAHRPALGPCWIWTAAIDPKGYGQFVVMSGAQGRSLRAHRVAWELLRDEIPDDLDLDHLCRVRACVNPDHLEPVTNEENNRRGVSPSAINARKEYCDFDHEFTLENTYHPPKRPHTRQCRECNRRRRRQRRQRLEAA